MTAPSRARRHAANVEVMRLDDLGDLVIARRWVEAHGLSTHIAAGRALLAWDDRSTLLTACLGQVLTYDPTTGEFAVLDAAVYDKTHTAALGVAE